MFRFPFKNIIIKAGFHTAYFSARAEFSADFFLHRQVTAAELTSSILCYMLCNDILSSTTKSSSSCSFVSYTISKQVRQPHLTFCDVVASVFAVVAAAAAVAKDSRLFASFMNVLIHV